MRILGKEKDIFSIAPLRDTLPIEAKREILMIMKKHKISPSGRYDKYVEEADNPYESGPTKIAF
jgi:hypothetical protein